MTLLCVTVKLTVYFLGLVEHSRPNDPRVKRVKLVEFFRVELLFLLNNIFVFSIKSDVNFSNV